MCPAGGSWWCPQRPQSSCSPSCCPSCSPSWASTPVRPADGQHSLLLGATAHAALVVTEKAVGKHSTSIFAKLDLPPDNDDNRRVLAVLAYLQAGDDAT